MTYSVPTQVLEINPNQPDPDAIEQAAATIKRGGLVAFPTETVYGLGANALDADAIDRIFAAKQRPSTDPIIAHIYDLIQLDKLTIDAPASVQALATAFWPGPLTLVLKRNPDVPANIAAGRDTIAVRMPSHPIAQTLLQACGLPIAAPSANTFTRPSATSAQHVLEDLDGHVDLILDGGSAHIGLESTVLDLTAESPQVLRPGGVLLQDIQAILPDTTRSTRYVSESEAATSPGQMLKHYAPRARMLVYSGETDSTIKAMHDAAEQEISLGSTVGILTTDDDVNSYPPQVQVIGLGDNLEAISHHLFAAMRKLDAAGVDVIITRDFGREALGAALWDRLVRAAEGRIIQIV